MLRSPRFWEQRSLHPVARLVLVLVVGVLLLVAIGFIVAGGKFTRYDLLAVAFYAGLAAFAWHPMTAAFIVMLISSVGVVFTESGGDLLELAIALSLVAVTCAPWVIVAHVVLLGLLTTFIAVDSSTLATGGVFGIVGIAAIAFLVGVAFRLVAARETVLVAERARVAQDLAAIAREDQEQIADELHDGIAHDLTLILFHARALTSTAGPGCARGLAHHDRGIGRAGASQHPLAALADARRRDGRAGDPLKSLRRKRGRGGHLARRPLV